MPPAENHPADLVFTGMALDRASAERKDDGWVRGLLERSGAHALAAGVDGIAVADHGSAALLRVPLPAPGQEEPILLGLDDAGQALFAFDLEDLSPGARGATVDGAEIVTLREAGLVLPHAEAGLAAYVVAMLNWHRRHRFCANCGTRTVIQEAGYSRVCPNCGAHHFPRTDPCVIMTVEHDGRLLLGRRTGWPRGRVSILAGFVSPGESAEEAVVREVREESGIVAREPVFVASQPWPFPASLMLGFHAESDGGEPRAADGELEEVHWVDRDTVREAINGGDVGFALPPGISIASALIGLWAARHDRA